MLRSQSSGTLKIGVSAVDDDCNGFNQATDRQTNTYDTPHNTTMIIRETFPDAQPLGSIAQSQSTIDYTATILTDRDADDPPDVTDYGFGQPVMLPMGRRDADEVAIGVVHGTQVIDPGVGGLGPTLGADGATDQFRPSLVDEPTTLVGIALLGSATVTGNPSDGDRIEAPDHSIPTYTIGHSTTVYQCPEATFRMFHLVDGDLSLAYYPRLTEVAGAFGGELVGAIADRLRKTTEGYDDLLDVIERKVAHQANVDRGVLQ